MLGRVIIAACLRMARRVLERVILCLAMVQHFSLARLDQHGISIRFLQLSQLVFVCIIVGPNICKHESKHIKAD